jgi:hypothetical protein
MKRIDQLLSQNPFSIDESACYVAAQLLKGYRGDSVETQWGSLPIGERLLFKLAFISICHQINWDFLQDRLASSFINSSSGSLLEILERISATDIERLLQGYSKPDRIRGAERAGLLRDVANVITSQFHGNPLQIYTESKQQIAGDNGLLAQLDKFQAFREDPLRKKSNVFLQEIVREKIAHFKDEDNIRPAIDYHILRLYLRTGRVVCSSIELQELLKKGLDPRARLTNLLRQTVGEALDLTAFYANLAVGEVNYIEWQLGRAVCTTESPACLTMTRNPELEGTVAVLFDGPCIYLSTCETCRDPTWRQLKEPISKKSFY